MIPHNVIIILTQMLHQMPMHQVTMFPSYYYYFFLLLCLVLQVKFYMESSKITTTLLRSQPLHFILRMRPHMTSHCFLLTL